MRSNFSSSRLVRLLGEWTPVDAEGSAMDFAERLSLWVNAFDAIGLQSAQQAIQAIHTAAVARPSDLAATRVRALQDDVQRVRAALAQAIADDPGTLDERRYAPHQQRHLELQRQMEHAIAPLRDRVRQALARVSPALRKLASLDAVFEHLLAAREQALLPTAAGLLERRFEQLRAAAPDDAACDWLPAFRRDWQQALLAELDLRLAPVTGLLEAMSNEFRNRA